MGGYCFDGFKGDGVDDRVRTARALHCSVAELGRVQIEHPVTVSSLSTHGSAWRVPAEVQAALLWMEVLCGSQERTAAQDGIRSWTGPGRRIHGEGRSMDGLLGLRAGGQRSPGIPACSSSSALVYFLLLDVGVVEGTRGREVVFRHVAGQRSQHRHDE